MHYTLRVTAPAPEVAHVSVRRQQFVVGRPLELDEASPRIAAVEYVLGAIAGEVVNGLRMAASKRRLAIDQVEAVVTGEVAGEAVYLEVVGESGRPAIVRAHVKIFVASPDESRLRRVWTELPDRLPLVCTMREAFPIGLESVMTQ
jgi:uncharacterized OsmC-like protein